MRIQFITLTGADGTPVHLALNHITAIATEKGSTVVYTVDCSSESYWRVKESPEEVLKLINPIKEAGE
jgi:hypothetical protein